MKEISTKLIMALLTAALLGGFSFVKDIESRLAVIEDDLDETVKIVGSLHPPQKNTIFEKTRRGKNKRKKKQ
jgi:alpha/beta superfamily hydrolase